MFRFWMITRATSCSVRFSQIFRFARPSCQILSRHSELISKYNVGFLIVLQKGLSEPEYYGGLVYKLRRIASNTIFSDQIEYFEPLQMSLKST